MKVSELIKDFTDKKICNTKINENAVANYLKQTLEIKTYIPFRNKRAIVESIVDANIMNEDGIKKIDSINQYISFVMAMLIAHTSLEIVDPFEDYDALAESKLLPQIIAIFQESYNECQLLLNLCVQNELEENNVNALVGKFLNGILGKIDVAEEFLKSTIGSIDIQEIMKEENLVKLVGLLNK